MTYLRPWWDMLHRYTRAFIYSGGLVEALMKGEPVGHPPCHTHTLACTCSKVRFSGATVELSTSRGTHLDVLMSQPETSMMDEISDCRAGHGWCFWWLRFNVHVPRPGFVRSKQGASSGGWRSGSAENRVTSWPLAHRLLQTETLDQSIADEHQTTSHDRSTYITDLRPQCLLIYAVRRCTRT